MNKILFVILFYYTSIFSAECIRNSLHDTIYNDLHNYLQKESEGYVLSLGNIIFPTCPEIEKKMVTDSTLINGSTPLECWLTRYLFKFAANKLVYMTDVKDGDDWIIGWHTFNGKYVQYIDGRNLTVLLRLDNEDAFEVNSKKLYETIYSKLNKIINFNSLSLDENSGIQILRSNSGIIEGYFNKTYNNLNQYKKDYIWTNGRYIVLVIFKIGYPYRTIKGDIYQYRYIINSIPVEDKRSYKRFRTTGNIDMKEEMFKVFPWMRDSIKYYRTNQSELNGRTPTYILDKK